MAPSDIKPPAGTLKARSFTMHRESFECMEGYGLLRMFRKELPDPDSELFPRYHVLQNFHQFNKLPPELRLKIWNLLPRARRLVVSVDDYFCLRTDATMPVTFRINRESRAETIRHYAIPYTLSSYPPEVSQRALHQHYFDPKIDIVHVPDTSPNGRCNSRFLGFLLDVEAGFTGEDMSAVELLEIDFFLNHYIFSSEDGCIEWDENTNMSADELFANMKSLKEFTIVQ